MPIARAEQVSVELTPWYHVMSRCVRRAFLCGQDEVSGKNFDHRKVWLADKMKELAAVFAVDVAAYAVMSNHFHMVVRIDRQRADGWSDEEVLERVGKLFPARVAGFDALAKTVQKQRLKEWRARLWDLSWFMRCLNESIARRANKEDKCKGRFWEGRFRSQALLDEGGLLTCMAYVDLNPMRAGAAKSLEGSEFTSIQERLRQVGLAAQKRLSGPKRNRAKRQEEGEPGPLAELLAFSPPEAEPQVVERAQVPMLFDEYVALLRRTGAAIRHNQVDALPPKLAPIVRRAGLDPAEFIAAVRDYSRTFFTMVGQVSRIELEGARLGKQRVKGVGAAARLYAKAW